MPPCVLKHHISLIVGFLLMGAAVMLRAMPAEQVPSPTTTDRFQVLLDSIRETHTQRSARFAGVTLAKNRALLSFAVPARVLERQVESGSTVVQGQILARLDDREFRNAADRLIPGRINSIAKAALTAGRL
jgi:multidrug efflux pump subunit AcrA (membrane-fusion protein)